MIGSGTRVLGNNESHPHSFCLIGYMYMILFSLHRGVPHASSSCYIISTLEHRFLLVHSLAPRPYAHVGERVWLHKSKSLVSLESIQWDCKVAFIRIMW